MRFNIASRGYLEPKKYSCNGPTPEGGLLKQIFVTNSFFVFQCNHFFSTIASVGKVGSASRNFLNDSATSNGGPYSAINSTLYCSKSHGSIIRCCATQSSSDIGSFKCFLGEQESSLTVLGLHLSIVTKFTRTTHCFTEFCANPVDLNHFLELLSPYLENNFSDCWTRH